MRNQPARIYTVRDTSINVWLHDVQLDSRLNSDVVSGIYFEIRKHLKRRGFTFQQDPETAKRYPSLRSSHHVGGKKNLRFHTNYTGIRIEVTFFEDLVRDNKNGGRYHYDKLKKMPYLLQLRTRHEITLLCSLLSSLSFTDASRPNHKSTWKQVACKRREVMDFHGIGFYEKPTYSYNATDADGNILRDGDFRYFYDYRGHIGCGHVYYDLNASWYVVTNDSAYYVVSCGELFATFTGMRRKPLSRDARRSKLKSLEEKAVNAKNYERAIVLRDLLKELAS